MEKLRSMIKKAALALPAMALLTSAMQVSAADIQYLQTGHATGTLNGAAFDSDFVIMSLADTDNVSSCGASCLYNNNLATMITIDGASNAPLNLITGTSYVSTASGLSFATAGAATSLIVGSALPSWDMTSSIGYLFNSATFENWSSVGVLTTGGTLVFNNATITSGFSALTSVPDVPVPASAWLFGSGIIGFAGALRRKTNI